MKKIIMVLLTVFAVLTLSSMVLATGTVAGTEVVEGTPVSGSSSTFGTVTATGGDITEMDLTREAQTSYWQAYFGTVSNVLTLWDNTDAVYEWSSAKNIEWVFLSNSSTVTWTSLGKGDVRVAEDTALGLTGLDNVNSTFTGSTHAAVNIEGNVLTANGAPSVLTLSKGGSDWTTALFSQGSTAVYGGQVNVDNEAYDGSTVDYQMMVPTDGTTRTYYVFVLVN